jgi:uncharacterized membrane protein YebE (DUF533 family)
MLGGGGSAGGLGPLLGGGTGAMGGSGGGLLGQLAGAMLGGGMRGGAGGVGSMGGLGGMGGSLARMGGMAVLGSLAASLLKQMSQGRAAAPAPEEAAQQAISADPKETAETALLMIRGMIAAAKADGEIDAEEQRNILGKLGDAANSPEARSFLEREMAAPLDIDALVASVKDKMTGAKLFAASALAINADTPAEQIYLRTLAQRLGLELPTASA